MFCLSQRVCVREGAREVGWDTCYGTFHQAWPSPSFSDGGEWEYYGMEGGGRDLGSPESFDRFFWRTVYICLFI